MVRTQGFDKISEKILDQVISETENLSEGDLELREVQGGGEAEIHYHLNAYSVEGSIKYQAYKKAEYFQNKGYTKLGAIRKLRKDLGNSDISNEIINLVKENWDDIKQLETAAFSAFGKLANAQGKMLEYFLTYLRGTIKEDITNLAQEQVDSLVAQVLDSASANASGGMKGTEGDKQLSYSMTFNDKEIIVESPQKTDAIFSFPYADGSEQELTVSAKNYSRLRDVKLLDNAKVIGLIDQAAGGGSGAKYLYNAMTIPSANFNYDMLNKIFLIQALTGQKANEVKSNVMVLYLGSNKNPFRVISTTSLLDNILSDPNALLGTTAGKMMAAQFIYEPSPPPVGEGGVGSPRKASDWDALENLTLSVLLSKEVLKLSYLKQLT